MFNYVELYSPDLNVIGRSLSSQIAWEDNQAFFLADELTMFSSAAMNLLGETEVKTIEVSPYRTIRLSGAKIRIRSFYGTQGFVLASGVVCLRTSEVTVSEFNNPQQGEEALKLASESPETLEYSFQYLEDAFTFQEAIADRYETEKLEAGTPGIATKIVLKSLSSKD